MTEAPLVEEYRGGWLENVHAGHICVVDGRGAILRSAGDPLFSAFMRSSAKPLQALPFFMHRVFERYPFSEAELAMLAASHRAEPRHVAALESMLAKTGLTEEMLVCHPTYPLSAAACRDVVAAGGGKRRIYHNCSGKHIGVLALCLAKGYPTEGYWRDEHPAQAEIRRAIAEMAGVTEAEIVAGTDGCGLPVYALPLDRIAYAFLRLANPDLIEGASLRAAAAAIAGIMNRHPDMLSGEGLICPALNRDENVVAKGGAKGVYAFGLRKERLGVALKILDGSEEEWPLIVATILAQLGYEGAETIGRLRELAASDIVNDNGLVVGESRAVFRL